MSLVVVGASANIARAARTLGEDLVFVQQHGTAVAHLPRDDVDEVFTVDLGSDDAVDRLVDALIRPRKPKAVVSVTENGLAAAARIAEALGTPGTPSEVVRTIRDKRRMRSLLRIRAPHLTVDVAEPGDEAAVRRLFAAHRRVVAKPAAGTASAGVRVLTSVDEVAALPAGEAYILEEFAEGVEYSVESFSRDGRHQVVAVAEKGTTEGFVEVSHVVPPVGLDDRRSAVVARAVAELLDALGLRDGPAHTELKLRHDTVRIIETHNRPGGDGIADLVRLTTGIDWRRVCVGWPLGVTPEPSTARAAAAATVFFTAPPGRVASIAARPPGLAGAEVLDWEIDVQVGDRVGDLLSSRDRVGCATVVAASSQGCRDAVAALHAAAPVRTDPVR